MKLKHISFMVRDIEKSINFYELMTELTVIRRFTHEETKLAFLANKDGETEVEFICAPQGQKFEGKGMFLCFECEDEKLDDMNQLAKDKGFNPSDIRIPGDGSRYFYVYDPDGVSVQLRSWT